MSTIATRITADELLEKPPEGRCELVRGELIRMSPASSEHGWTVMNVALPVAQFVREHHLGYVFGAETGFLIARDPDTVRAPDVAFVCRDRVAGKLPRKFFPGAPDLAVEVLSPSDSASAVQEKAEDWLRAGCREVWLIDPRRQAATRCTLQDGGVVWRSVEQLTTDLFPGLTIDVAGLFR